MKRSLLLIILLSTFVNWTYAQQEFRIIGYLPFYRFGIADQLEMEKLTHLNISFANPDANGNLKCSGDYQTVIKKAKEKNPDLKVFISLAGGALTSSQNALWKMWMSAENRTFFISNIIQFVLDNEMAGVDMDLEWNYVNDLYPPFIHELADSLHHYGMEFSGAFPAMKKYNVMQVEDFEAFDFINIMAYDNAGPWRPNDIGQHSSFEFSKKCIQFWRTVCNIPKEKLVLGMPCYGYDFDRRPVKGTPYSSIVSCDRYLAFEDQNNKTYYNSIPTIINKTLLAREQCSGVMLWELGQDAVAEYGDYSLLHFVFSTVLTGNNDPFLPRPKKFRSIILDDELLVEINTPMEEGSYFILRNLDGSSQQVIHFSSYTNRLNVNMEGNNGIYFLTLVEPNDKTTTEKLIKVKS